MSKTTVIGARKVVGGKVTASITDTAKAARIAKDPELWGPHDEKAASNAAAIMALDPEFAAEHPKKTIVQRAASAVAGAIDRADAQGRGCAGCKAVRKVARKMFTKLARPR